MKQAYLNRLTHSFPEHLKSDVLIVFKVIPLESKHSFSLISAHFYEVMVNEEKLKIPVRIYFDEPKQHEESQLTERQKNILNCIYTRHHNGFIREKRLNKIVENPAKWKIPYVVQLMGEYIYKILLIIDKKVNKNTLPFFIDFKNENPKYWQQTESRMISYWNVYYRNTYPKLKAYLGFKIMSQIN